MIEHKTADNVGECKDQRDGHGDRQQEFFHLCDGVHELFVHDLPPDVLRTNGLRARPFVTGETAGNRAAAVLAILYSISEECTSTYIHLIILK